jgi:hypothetical protein
MSALKSWYTRAGLAALLATSASCSLIYDADVFDVDPPDAAVPDAVVPDAEVPPDADPDALRIIRLDPAEVFEGAGCIPVGAGCRGDSRAVPIVIHGANIQQNAQVVVTGPGFPEEGATAALTIRPDGTMAAFALSVPVLPELGEEDTAALTVTLRQLVGQVEAEAEITLGLHTLNEFVATVDAPEGTFDSGMLRGLYSRIDIDRSVRFTGEPRVQLIAVAELVIQDELSAAGGNAMNEMPGAAGPGGCLGGAPQAAGGCAGGGKGATSTGGGGGGGHAEQGDNGGGNGAGAGGTPVGSPFLTPMAPTSTASARGHGGGGGSVSCVDLTGPRAGAGGGGGGTIELTSHGLLRLTREATLTVKGGNGSAGSCNALGGGAGGGGGGSGGAILARAAMAFTDEGTESRVDVGPGTGGGGDGPDGGGGGDGGPGRVRVDAPDPQTADTFPPAFSGVTHRYRGPMWSPTIPAIVTSFDGLTLALSGQPQQRVHLDIEGQRLDEPIFPEEGAMTVAIPSLMPGPNQVCARVPAGDDTSQPDAFNCIDIAYIPVPPPP